MVIEIIAGPINIIKIAGNIKKISGNNIFTGIFEASKYASPCEVSRETIMTYLRVLESTFAVHILRPFNTHQSSEIIAAPRVFGLDTGFVCCQKRWPSLQPASLQ